MVSILWGLMGCTVIVLAAFLMSENRKAINIWTVSMGFIAQVVLGFIVLKWDVGRSIIQFLSNGVSKVMDYGVEGLTFVFGSLADKAGAAGPIFAINALAIMIYLTALIGLLYHFGVMQWFVRIVGGGLSKVMKTGHIESTNAAANIFLGMTQSFLSVNPYIRTMSRSQLFAVMVGGLASVSGAVLLGLAAMGIPINYLLSAAIMSAPAGLMLAKLIIPETEELDPDEWKVAEEVAAEPGEKTSVMEVIVTESNEGLKFAVNAVVILVSIIGLIALLNGILGGIGSLAGLPNLSFELILGYLFAPVAFILGIPWSEAVLAGNLLGQKIIINEFVAFASFKDMIDVFSDKSVAILTFALSGFANLGSVGIILGVMLGIAPKRKKEISDMALKGLIAATLANLLNGAIVGIFFF